MANPSRRKGTTFEVTVRDYLNDSGVFTQKVERAPLWGAADQGDLLNTGAFAVECKATKSIDLSAFVDQAEKEAANAGKRWGVAVIKRRRKSTEKAYVAMTLQTFVDIVRRLPIGDR